MDELTDFLLTDQARCYVIVPASRLVHIRDKHVRCNTFCDLETRGEQRDHPTYRVGRTRLCAICHDAAIEREAGVDAPPAHGERPITNKSYFILRRRNRARFQRGLSQGDRHEHRNND